MKYAHITNQQIAFLAGIFEGEGSVHIKNKSDTSLELSIQMTDPDVVSTVHDLLPGSTMRFIPPKEETDNKPAWRVSLFTYEDVAEICGRLYPYLHVRRREQIQRCLTRVALARKTPHKANLSFLAAWPVDAQSCRIAFWKGASKKKIDYMIGKVDV